MVLFPAKLCMAPFPAACRQHPATLHSANHLKSSKDCRHEADKRETLLILFDPPLLKSQLEGEKTLHWSYSAVVLIIFNRWKVGRHTTQLKQRNLWRVFFHLSPKNEFQFSTGGSRLYVEIFKNPIVCEWMLMDADGCCQCQCCPDCQESLMDPIRCPHARKAAPVTSASETCKLRRHVKLTWNKAMKRCVEHVRQKMMECEGKIVNVISSLIRSITLGLQVVQGCPKSCLTILN